MNEPSDNFRDILKPMTLDDLRARIAPAQELPKPQAAAPTAAPSAPKPETKHTESKSGFATDQARDYPFHPGKPAESIPQPTTIPQPIIPEQTTQGLGDTDLVEALLSPTSSVQPIALQLIAEQTGWIDISRIDLEAGKAPPPADQSTASNALIGFNNHYFGCLQTAMGSADQLQPWADWLARWLTLEHAHRDFRLKSLKDDLTGAWNRRFFNSFLKEAIARSGKERRPVTVMVFDIDNFKPYNDNFGHEAGDEVLRETVRLLTSVIRQGDRVCRIGGDEFAVIFADPEGPRKPVAAGGGSHPDTVEMIAKRFQDQICKMRFPKLGEQAPGNLSISAGLATFPWDGHDPATLLRHADQLALESKRKGKNAITFGPGAKRACGPDRRTPAN